MIDNSIIKKHKIYSLSKSNCKKNGKLFYLGKSMEGYFIVVTQDETGQEAKPLIYSSYSKARSSIGIPSRMVPVFKRANHLEVRCECCGQVVLK